MRPPAHAVFKSTVFSQVDDQHSHTLDLDTSKFLALHDLIGIRKHPYSIFAHKTMENEDECKLFVTFQEEDISSDSFDLLDNNKNPNSHADIVKNCT